MPSSMQGKNNVYSAVATGTAAMKATPGSVRSLHATNRNAALRYLLLYNQASGAPSGTTNYVCGLTVFPGSALTVGPEFFRDQGIAFATGIVYGWSTTNGTYTAATAGEHDLMAVYA